ncbi:MAG TPA: RidA family protein [Candidatus Limnocylindrales bacterium]|nr:RidA family protein [Candidatus Limnocylindrales bacterium]
MIEFFDPPDAPAPGAFSRATRAAGLVFVSGTSAGPDATGHPRAGTAAEETQWAIRNVGAILKSAGSSLDRVVQVTMLITDPADYREINAEYVRHFPGGLPARHTARFGVPTTAKVAFACIALAGDGGPP